MSKYSILILGCLLFVGLSSSTGDEVPSIAISCGNTPLGTLPKYQPSMNTLEFTKLLSFLSNEDTKVVVVLENELSLEDFTMKDADGHSLFQLFENHKDRRFFPLVNQPEKAIEMLSQSGFSVKAYNDETFTNDSKKIIAVADLGEFNPAEDNNRHSTLSRHNNDVSKIFNNLCKQYTNVVLVFSGKINPWFKKSEISNAHHLVTRHLMTVDSESPKFKIVDSKGLIYSASYPILSAPKQPDGQLKATASEVFHDDSRDSLLKIGNSFIVNDAKITLRFRFEKTTFTWELKSIECDRPDSGLNTLLTPQQPITALLGLSYFSEGPVIFSNDTVVLKFNDKFQVQPWLSSSQNAKFSEPQEQNSFFTPPILAGLFVTFLMLSIVTWGITMIMDIKTMDRFDDPKGKTISINVAE